MLNGDGLRVVLWVAGCEHKCKGCHNPITWDVDGGLPFDQSAKEEIFAELDKDYVSGLTLSGGDPLHLSNRQTVTELVKEVREKYPNKTIWVYTGYLWGLVKDLEIIKYIDVLVDGRFDIERHSLDLHWVGSSNQRIIDCKKSIGLDKPVLFYEVE